MRLQCLCNCGQDVPLYHIHNVCNRGVYDPKIIFSLPLNLFIGLVSADEVKLLDLCCVFWGSEHEADYRRTGSNGRKTLETQSREALHERGSRDNDVT